MSMNETNKFLTVAMGECWTDLSHRTSARHIVESDGSVTWEHMPDFSTPDGFFKLWNWAQTQEWWNRFVFEIIGPHIDVFNLITTINPERFAAAVYEFLKEQG